MHLNGTGTSKNVEEAVRLFTEASKAGDARSDYVLGGLYETGKGVTQSDFFARKHYSLAAKRGHKEAKKKLTSKAK